jgi:hypothetical protein
MIIEYIKETIENIKERTKNPAGSSLQTCADYLIALWAVGFASR